MHKHREASALSFNSNNFFPLAIHSSKNKFLKYTINDLPKIQWEMSLVILVSTPQTEFIISTTILCTSLLNIQSIRFLCQYRHDKPVGICQMVEILDYCLYRGQVHVMLQCCIITSLSFAFVFQPCGLKSSDLKSLKHNKQQKTSQFGMFALFIGLIPFGGLLHLNHTLMSQNVHLGEYSHKHSWLCFM